MNALSSLSTSVTSFHESDYGMGEAIVYTHKSPASIENTFAIVEDNKFNQQEDSGQDTKNIRADDIVFANVKLLVAPVPDDKITYDGEVWDVLDYSKSIGLYTIVARANARHSGRPEKRRV